jgi:hypothetical protein
MGLRRLTIFQDDDITTWATFTTDPAGTNPYLKEPGPGAESEIDLLHGSASIGQLNLEVVDVPTTPGDQSSGIFTSLLATAGGETALNGRLALYEVNRGGTWVTALRGVVWRVELVKLSTFRLELRDVREREREHAMFELTRTPTVIPPGVLEGYGKPYPGAPEALWLIPPTKGVKARWKSTGTRRGEIWFDVATTTVRRAPSLYVAVVPPDLVVNERILNALAGNTQLPMSRKLPPGVAVRGALRRYDRIDVLWRTGGSGAWTEVETPLADHMDGVLTPAGLRSFSFKLAVGIVPTRDGELTGAAEAYLLAMSVVVDEGNEALLPSSDGEIEVVIRYHGPVSEEWPLHLEGMTEGEFLKACYDGDFSRTDPRIPYDEAAVLSFDRPIRARITERVEDMRGWLESNFYAPRGSAPAVWNGEVYPIKYEIPPDDVSLPQLDGTNCKPLPGWYHGADDAVNQVEVTYKRDSSVALIDNPKGEGLAGDRIVSRDVQVVHRSESSIELLGERTLELNTDLFRAVAGKEGEPVSGDVTDEVGHQLSMERAFQAIDRFRYGGQHIEAQGMRSDPDVEGLRPGDWVLAAASWWPDYQTGKRGANRLAQVVGRQDTDASWTTLRLEDAGPSLQPVGQPTLGTLAVTAEGEVEVPITAVATGSEARVDFLVSDTTPVHGNPGWLFAGRTGAGSSVFVPPQRSGGRVWVRARGEAEGRRSSAWTEPVSIQLESRPRLFDLRVTFAEDGTPTVHCTDNGTVGGVRIIYAVHERDPEEDPTLTESEDFVVATEYVLDTVVLPGDQLTLEITPYLGFSGGSVTGTAGETQRMTATRRLPFNDNVPWGTIQAVYVEGDELLQAVFQGNHLGQSFAWVLYRSELPPEDPAPDDTGAGVEDSGTVDNRVGVVEVANLDPLTGSENFWMVAWWYGRGEQEGERGPAVVVPVQESDTLLVPRRAWLEIVTETDGSSSAGFSVRLRDPSGYVSQVQYRIVVLGQSDTGWLNEAGTPEDFNLYSRSEPQGPGKVIQISFRARWMPPGAHFGDAEYIRLDSRLFGDVEAEPSVFLTPLLGTNGELRAVGSGVSKILSFRFLAGLTAPLKSAVQSATPVNGNPATSGLLLTLNAQQIGIIRAIGYTGLDGTGDQTEMVEARAVFGVPHQPRIFAQATRAEDEVTLSLQVEDLSLVVTQVEFRTRASDASTWSSWSSIGFVSGSIGVDQHLSRSSVIAAPAGKDTQIEWRVIYVNEQGSTNSVGDVILAANLTELTKQIYVPHSAFTPRVVLATTGSPNYTVQTLFSFNHTDDRGLEVVRPSHWVDHVGPVLLPPGTIVTQLEMRSWRRTSVGGFVQLTLTEGTITGGSVTVGTLIRSSGSGWNSTFIFGVNKTVGTLPLMAWLLVEPDSLMSNPGAGHAFRWLVVTYLAPGYAFTY